MNEQGMRNAHKDGEVPRGAIIARVGAAVDVTQ